MIEEWRDITGFEGLYQVSSFGRVYSLPKEGSDGRKLPGRFMSERWGGKRKYANVQLFKDGRPHHRYVHRLVAGEFHENANGYPEVNHKDRDRRNNRLDNLEWTSPQRNTEHSHSKHYVLETEDGLVEVFNLRKYCRDNNLDRNRVKKMIVKNG